MAIDPNSTAADLQWVIGVNVLALGALTVPRRIDLAGLTLTAAGIGLFTLMFDRAPTWDWLSATTVFTLGRPPVSDYCCGALALRGLTWCATGDAGAGPSRKYSGAVQSNPCVMPTP